jgi:CheY-like chemotaxis protein
MEAEQAEQAKQAAAGREAEEKRGLELEAAFRKALAKAKAKTCPGPSADWELGEDLPAVRCGLSPTFFDDVLAAKGRYVAICADGEEDRHNPGHRWDLATGKLDLTPAERKVVDKILKDRHRQAVEANKQEQREARAEKEVAKESRELDKKAKKDGPVQRDYASIYSRTPYDKLLQIVADFAKPALQEVQIDEGDTITICVDKERLGLPDLVITPIEMPDGKGGTFHARIRIGHYGSGTPAWAGPGNYSGRGDDVAEGPSAIHLRKVRAALLRVIAKAGGAKQREDDLWPVAVKGFRLGETVAIGPKYETQGYRGKKGQVRAFDPEWIADKHRSYYGERGPTITLRPDRMYAVLDIAEAKKAFPVWQLLKVEARGPAKKAKGRTKGRTKK